MAHLSPLLAAYRRLSRRSDDLVLATIVETFGSTYQKAGARMLIGRDGILTGLLGGGCFEADLLEHARSVFGSGTPKTVFYDMRSPDDAVWGLGLGCNGAVRIFLQLLRAADDFSPLNTLAAAAQDLQTGILATVIESKHPDFQAGHSLFFADSAEHPPVSFLAASWGLVPAALPKPCLEAHRVDGLEIKVFYERLQPPPQLLVLGAGADAVPLVGFAKALGWRVSVADHRPGHAQKARFPEADEVLHLLPQAFARERDWDRFDAAVLMTHNLDYDRRFLDKIADTRIPFVGLLGPAPRRERLLDSLDDAERLDGRLYGPVGLDIGAETPEEIALAIVAGIKAALKGRQGGQLRLKVVPSAAVCGVR